MNSESAKHIDRLVANYPMLEPVREQVQQAAELLCACYRAGGKVMTCGNGGSAADSEHIAGELMKGFLKPRTIPATDMDTLESKGFGDLVSCLQQGAPTIALTGNVPVLTAVQNDTAPQMGFAQQVYVLGRPGDLLIGISTSGNSRNVVNAVKVAASFGITTIGLTGSIRCELDDLCDVVIKAPASETYRVQEYHLPIYHTLCLVIEEELFG